MIIFAPPNFYIKSYCFFPFYQIEKEKETSKNSYFRADISYNMKSEPETCLYRFPAHQRIYTFCSVFNFALHHIPFLIHGYWATAQFSRSSNPFNRQHIWRYAEWYIVFFTYSHHFFKSFQHNFPKHAIDIIQIPWKALDILHPLKIWIFSFIPLSHQLFRSPPEISFTDSAITVIKGKFYLSSIKNLASPF